ncbi:MAG: hypothetical protein Q4G62_11550 [Pseudomonadota bacterium]|nr:hypothetical protein [Pseudomonadota bacterium]
MLLIGVLIALVASINALRFSSQAATPLVQADAWFFVEHFVSKYLDGTLTFSDLFIQRGAGDHAQPLQKLILLWHTHYFGMDFRIEGIIGTLAGIVFCCLIALPLALRNAADKHTAALQSVLIGMLFALALSLNATNIYTWPLVTLGFVVLAAAAGLIFLMLGTRVGRHPAITLVLAFVLGMLTDEQGVIFATALVIGMLLFDPRSLRARVHSSIAIMLGIIASRLLFAWLAQRHDISSEALEAGAPLADLLKLPDVLNAAGIPLGDSLLHRAHWDQAGPHQPWLRWGSIAIAAIMHLWVWLSLLRLRLQGRRDIRLVMVVALMLTSYAILLGIVVNRVGQFGWDYLHQPRYVFYYQLSWLAALILMHQRLGDSPQRPALTSPLWIAAIIMTLVLAGVQVHVSRKAWQMAPYLADYWSNAAIKMEEIRVDPQARTDNCPDILTACHYAPEHRIQVIGLLAEHRLNIYSPEFQQRNTWLSPPADGEGTPRVTSNAAESRAIKSTNGMLTVHHAVIDMCEVPNGVVSSLVSWNASATGTEGTQVWLKEPGKNAVLWSEAGAVFESTTGQWLRNGSEVILINAQDKRELARVSITARPCRR